MIFVRTIKCLSILQYGLGISEKRVCRNCVRKLSRNSIRPETLLYRFYNFFRSSPKYSEFVVENTGISVSLEKYKHVMIENNVNDLPRDATIKGLQNYVVSLSVKESDDRTDFKRIIRNLDTIYCEKLKCVTVEDSLKMNYCWLMLLGTSVTKLKSFTRSLEILKHFLTDKKVLPEHIILIIFYAGFAKKDPKAKEIVAIALSLLCNKGLFRELSTLELIIVIDIAFKTGTKIIYPSLFKHLTDTASKNLNTFATDLAIFVSLIKTFRHNKYYDYTFLKHIENYFYKNEKILMQYNFTAQVHILALYADSLYGEHEFLSFIINSVTKSLSKSGSYRPFKEKGKNATTGRIRAKDLARLLWATSYLGFKLNSEVYEKRIMPILLNKATEGVYTKNIGVLIDSVLSLWIMGYKPVQVISYVFSEEMVKSLTEGKRMRHNYRLQLLFTCISIESPEMLKDIPAATWPTPTSTRDVEKDHLTHRSGLQDVVQVVKSIAWRFNILDVQCEMTIPTLNIPGIVLKTSDCNNRNFIHVEVLDETNCLYKTDIPHGLMLLKLRLLRQLKRRVILVNYSNHRSNHSSLIKYIEDEINKNG